MRQPACRQSGMVAASHRPIRNLRWYIGALLFLSTVINYIDRQALGVLAPRLKLLYGWTNTDYSYIVIAFRLAYALGQTLSGRFLDRFGTRKGLSFAVAFYSLAAMATSLATGFFSLCCFRFFLGLGESANWPGAAKAVSEWFPRRESGWAVALFDSGSSVGGAIAPALVLLAVNQLGSWRLAFIFTGILGIGWLLLFRRFYYSPEEHPRISDAEKELILAERGNVTSLDQAPPISQLLKLPQTWGIVLAKSLSDPVWFFITEWFGVYLAARGFDLEKSLLGWWSVFVAADAGNFIGGGVSSYLISRGWPAGRSRKLVAVLGGLGMTLLIPATFATSYLAIVSYFAVATLSYAAFSTIVLNLPGDVFPSRCVASVSGLSGTGAGLCTIVAMLAVGRIADKFSFKPVLIGASLIPLLAIAAVLLLIRNADKGQDGFLNEI